MLRKTSEAGYPVSGTRILAFCPQAGIYERFPLASGLAKALMNRLPIPGYPNLDLSFQYEIPISYDSAVLCVFLMWKHGGIEEIPEKIHTRHSLLPSRFVGNPEVGTWTNRRLLGQLAFHS